MHSSPSSSSPHVASDGNTHRLSAKAGSPWAETATGIPFSTRKASHLLPHESPASVAARGASLPATASPNTAQANPIRLGSNHSGTSVVAPASRHNNQAPTVPIFKTASQGFRGVNSRRKPLPAKSSGFLQDRPHSPFLTLLNRRRMMRTRSPRNWLLAGRLRCWGAVGQGFG